MGLGEKSGGLVVPERAQPDLLSFPQAAYREKIQTGSKPEEKADLNLASSMQKKMKKLDKTCSGLITKVVSGDTAALARYALKSS